MCACSARVSIRCICPAAPRPRPLPWRSPCQRWSRRHWEIFFRQTACLKAKCGPRQRAATAAVSSRCTSAWLQEPMTITMRISTDSRNWTLESGVRLRDGSSVSQGGSIDAPYWPMGEGMTVDRLPSGAWRMIVGGYQHADPQEQKFQIVEWDSPDQLNWTYQGPVLTTQQMPPAGQGTVYGPNIRQVAPGLWRMIFAGDNRWEAGWRGRLWSAVSTDLQSWQVEGQLMGSISTNLRYPSLAGDQHVFLREDDGDVGRIAIATVSMP